MEGLTPNIRLMVGIQQPSDLDSAFALALLSKELGETQGSTSVVGSVAGNRRTTVQFPKLVQFKGADDRKQVQHGRPAATDDRWSALRAYRKSKGLCFTCGEKWSKDHVCKQEVQLHVVQEMLEYVQSLPADQSDSEDKNNLVKLMQSVFLQPPWEKRHQLQCLL